MPDLLINQMSARKVTKLLNESSIRISRTERYEDTGWGPAGEVYWVVQDENDNLSYTDPFFRLWEARECAIQWVVSINQKETQ
jgi:hypothetical protein